ncbi:hypothetical protein UY3_11641 [Chelonia mydas]|uniref:Uncharacterized protein n=1 Tax=Chelonia mydas TaxID=8469 RepID=M7B2D0_CHEMY|nr:hypothetical protein UY3_11641 [Chelonia mydas]
MPTSRVNSPDLAQEHGTPCKPSPLSCAPSNQDFPENGCGLIKRYLPPYVVLCTGAEQRALNEKPHEKPPYQPPHESRYRLAPCSQPQTRAHPVPALLGGQQSDRGYGFVLHKERLSGDVGAQLLRGSSIVSGTETTVLRFPPP